MTKRSPKPAISGRPWAIAALVHEADLRLAAPGIIDYGELTGEPAPGAAT